MRSRFLARIRQTLFLYALLFALFFFVSFGLGYATLNRYDSRTVPGMSDATEYYKLVTGTSQTVRAFRYRVLVPYLARPVYHLAQGRVGRWNAVFFALLVVNSLFVAGTAVLLFQAGGATLNNPLTALLGTLIYLLNFAITQFRLAAMVDAGADFFLLAMVLALLCGRWRWLPVLCAGGVLAKETFWPLAVIFAAVWWLTANARAPHRDFAALLWLGLMTVTGGVTLIAVQSWVTGALVWPWAVTASTVITHSGFLPNLFRCTLLSHEFWFVFGWLAVLGVWRWHVLPTVWTNAAFAAASLTLCLSAWTGTFSAASRVMFTMLGPVLSLTAAVWLEQLVRRVHASHDAEDMIKLEKENHARNATG